MQKLLEDGKFPNELDELPYIKAVIEGTMRVHYLGTGLRREAAEEANLAGTPIHAGIKFVWSP